MANNITSNVVYNHFLTTYAPKDTTRPETLKKDDLRSIYKSIVKSNRDNPLYLLNQNDRAEADAIGLKEHARTLQKTLSTLSDIGQEKPLGQRTAFSSNEEIVEARYIGSEAEGEEPPSFAVKVDHLATPQENTGLFLPDADVHMPADSYAFNIRMSDQVYELQFSIREGDSNRDVQERLARLINKAGIGLNASITGDEKGRSALKITAKNTGLPPGKDEQFAITEESDSGRKGTLAYFGLDRVTHPAQDAQFKINGQTHTSSSNRFTVSRIYELTLNRASDVSEEAVIGIKGEKESLVDHVHALVNGYNDFLDSIQTIGSDAFRTGKIMSETVRVAKDNLEGHESPIGLTLDQEGRLSIDEAKLSTASFDLTSDELSTKLSPVRAFAKALYSKTMAVALDPMQYITRPVVAYKNPGHELPNPYITSEYSGMLFNNYC